MGSFQLEKIEQSLKAEAAAGNFQSAKNLHSQVCLHARSAAHPAHPQDCPRTRAHACMQAVLELQKLQEYMFETKKALEERSNDLDDVRQLIDRLEDVHVREASIGSQLQSLEEMYSMLQKYQVSVPKQEIDAVSDLRMSWKTVLKLVADRHEYLGRLKQDIVVSVQVMACVHTCTHT